MAPRYAGNSRRKPAGPPDTAAEHPAKVLPGFPETILQLDAPGTYRFGVVVSLVKKSSCGGAETSTILEREARIDVGP
jgi:hypothetical protein